MASDGDENADLLEGHGDFEHDEAFRSGEEPEGDDDEDEEQAEEDDEDEEENDDEDQQGAQEGDGMEQGGQDPLNDAGRIQGHLGYLRENNVRETLCGFYLSKWYLKKAWKMHEGQITSYDFGIKAIMRLAGQKSVNEGRKRKQDVITAVFAVGLASFNTQTGLPSKHGESERRFVTGVRSLGYDILGVHEYYSSAKCLRRDCNTFLEQIKKTRSKYCRQCQAYMDRDQVGSENIAIICQAQIRDQERPPKCKSQGN
ncbi:hypothetical protein BGX28_002760 [Mortierella sp. GBA30]|nr:hypothetical protein BGX28_002760 [Mortierella sp. GBA30]